VSNPTSPPATLGGLVPYLMVSDAAAASDFYRRAFAAEEVARIAAPDDASKLIHVHLHLNGHSLMLNDPMPEHGYPLKDHQGYTLTLIVDDIDLWFDRAVDAGATVTTPVDRMFWGDRYGALIDPFGVQWAMNEPAKG
jgi:PhnB protein